MSGKPTPAMVLLALGITMLAMLVVVLAVFVVALAALLLTAHSGGTGGIAFVAGGVSHKLVIVVTIMVAMVFVTTLALLRRRG